MVIRTAPPSCDAAPINAYFPTSLKTNYNMPFNKLVHMYKIIFLTAFGIMYWTPIPINRPHAAPVAKHGIKRPALTLKPYVQIVRK